MTDDDADVALLGDLLERSFGSGPEGLPTPGDRLAEGRRALGHRRRLAIAAASAGVVAAVGVGVAVSGTGGDHGADRPPPLATSGASPSADASQSSPPAQSPAAVATPGQKTHKEQQKLVSAMFPASLDTDGQIVVKDGWRLTRQVDEPLGLTAPEKSAGVVVERGDHVRWMLLMLEHGMDQEGHVDPDTWSLSSSADDAGKGYSRFEDWLASQVDLQGGPKTQPLVTVDADDRLRPGPGAALVATRPAPVITDYTSHGDRLAEVRRADRTWFVVVRGHGADAEVIPVDADVLPEPTFAAFIDHLAAGVASGEGVR